MKEVLNQRLKRLHASFLLHIKWKTNGHANSGEAAQPNCSPSFTPKLYSITSAVLKTMAGVWWNHCWMEEFLHVRQMRESVGQSKSHVTLMSPGPVEAAAADFSWSCGRAGIHFSSFHPEGNQWWGDETTACPKWARLPWKVENSPRPTDSNSALLGPERFQLPACSRRPPQADLAGA